MSRVLILCKYPPEPKPDPRYPIINGMLPPLADMAISIDGVLVSVRGVKFEAKADGSPVRVWLEFDGADIEVEAPAPETQREGTIRHNVMLPGKVDKIEIRWGHCRNCGRLNDLMVDHTCRQGCGRYQP